MFPEQIVGGYMPEDLVQWRGFVDGQWYELERFARETAGLELVSILGAALWMEGLRYNCAVVVAAGEIIGVVPKQKLPMYSIFYEGRTTSAGLPLETGEINGVPFGDLIFRFDFGTIATEVCEDLWSPDGPMKRRAFAGAELVCNISASPYRIGVNETRRELISTRAGDCQCTVAYVNLFGSNDGLIFDGGGFVNQNGKSMLVADRFRRGFSTQVVDLDRTMRLRAENTTWRIDREQFVGAFDLPEVVDVPASLVDTSSGRATLAYPAPTSRIIFPPGRQCRNLAPYGAVRGSPRRPGDRRGGLLRKECDLPGHRCVAQWRTGFAADAADRAPVCEASATGQSRLTSARLLPTIALFVGRDPAWGGDDLPRFGCAARNHFDRRRLRPGARRGGGVFG